MQDTGMFVRYQVPFRKYDVIMGDQVISIDGRYSWNTKKELAEVLKSKGLKINRKNRIVVDESLK